jgi:hypothetical protein
MTNLKDEIEGKGLEDAMKGYEWWNSLSEQNRRFWMDTAGNTGRACDAWDAYKRVQAETHPHE